MKKGFLVILISVLFFPVFSQGFLPEELNGIWEGKDRIIFFEEPQNDKNMVKLAKNVDTRKKDNDNAKKIEKDIKKRFGIKTKKTGKKAGSKRTAKKAKSGRVSKTSK